MNCKPGDLAMVVVDGDYPYMLGRIFRVTTLSRGFHHCWETEPTQFDEEGHIVVFNDDSLKPIRPPRQSVTEGRDMEVTA